MREDARQKLDALLAQERRTLIVTGAALTTLFCVGFLVWVAPSGSSRDASGIVRKRWKAINPETQKVSLHLEVLLDDGRYAVATATFRHLPDIGNRVTLRQQPNWLGYQHYFWDGDNLPQPMETQ